MVELGLATVLEPMALVVTELEAMRSLPNHCSPGARQLAVGLVGQARHCCSTKRYRNPGD